MSFRSMASSLVEHWTYIDEHNAHRRRALAQRIIARLRDLEQLRGGFGINQLEHGLQAATRATKDGASDELVVAALCHDIGKLESVDNHGPVAAELLRPFVHESTYHTLYTHEQFVDLYAERAAGRAGDRRNVFQHEPWFALAEQFADQWDQTSFDPSYPTMDLDAFAPAIERVFGKTPRRWW
jgi:predicted HD phosphohydrolase